MKSTAILLGVVLALPTTACMRDDPAAEAQLSESMSEDGIDFEC